MDIYTVTMQVSPGHKTNVNIWAEDAADAKNKVRKLFPFTVLSAKVAPPTTKR